MSKEILREMVSAITRLRGEPIDSGRAEEWAARLEGHLTELEFLAAQAVADTIAPAFEATPLGAAPPFPAPPGGVSVVTEQPADVPTHTCGAPGGRPPTVAGPAAPSAALKSSQPMTLTAAIALLRARQLSALELVEDHLDRIRRAESLNVFIAVFEERARREALAAD